jgi:high-affinity iron transporter
LSKCCSPELNGGGGWGIFNGILGWTNSATYGTVISYNLYWLLVIVLFLAMRYHEVKGHWPLMRPKNLAEPTSVESTEQSSGGISVEVEAVERAT